MADTNTHDYQTWKRRLLRLRLDGMARLVATFRLGRRTLATRRAMADLTPDQLRDVGYPEAARPTLDVEAGLITNLMSMR